MTEQNLIPLAELIQVSSLLSIQDKELITKNKNMVFVLPIEDREGNFKGYFQLDAKVDSSFKAIQNDSLRSGLMPIVTGG